MSDETPALSSATIRRVPKVLLHDHLDGGLRPGTVAELAESTGYRDLPVTEPGELGRWFAAAANSGSLESYLSTFIHTCGVLQTEDALVRVAAESVEDLADDGVVYAEIRYAPELFVERGMSLDTVIRAVQVGFAEGGRRAAAKGRTIRIGTLLCAMRHRDRGLEIATLAVRYRDAGVVGFDIAGPEAGFAPARISAAFDYLRSNNAHFTIHAGEAFGTASISEAIHRCGAERLGHGVRIIDDIRIDDGEVHLGRLARYVRDRRIPLEICPSSNVQTGAAVSIAEHPIGTLARLGFRVTVNTDNRLMSGCSMSSEFEALRDAFGYGLADFERFTVDAMKSAFLDYDERRDLIDKVIRPGYAQLARTGCVT
ncbi:MAG: adenosine deaminase [Actinomycetota bacterium]|jgi:adenosine deaminase|nr:adenosine deaminase [Actinomycetota bacterium]